MEGDLSKNYDTLYGITRQGNWTEEQNEFLYGGTYNNDKKEGLWELGNSKFKYFSLKTEVYKKGILIKDSLFINHFGNNKKYFYGNWRLRHLDYLPGYVLCFSKGYNGTRFHFNEKGYFQGRDCSSYPEYPNKNWNFVPTGKLLS